MKRNGRGGVKRREEGRVKLGRGGKGKKGREVVVSILETKHGPSTLPRYL